MRIGSSAKCVSETRSFIPSNPTATPGTDCSKDPDCGREDRAVVSRPARWLSGNRVRASVEEGFRVGEKLAARGLNGTALAAAGV